MTIQMTHMAQGVAPMAQAVVHTDQVVVVMVLGVVTGPEVRVDVATSSHERSVSGEQRMRSAHGECICCLGHGAGVFTDSTHVLEYTLVSDVPCLSPLAISSMECTRL